MAGEATLRTPSVTLAFHRKRNAEWCRLRKHLHLQLQQDIERIYTNSLYCDLELVFDSTSVKTHSSILQVRAARFYAQLCTNTSFASNHNGLQSVAFKKASSDEIKSFVRNIYSKCVVCEEEDDLVHYLQDLKEPVNRRNGRGDPCISGREGNYDSALSPESDIYLTPNCSPSDFYTCFQKSPNQNKNSCLKDVNNACLEDPISDLHKTNRSYYTIVAVDEVFKDASSEPLSKNSGLEGVLEKELAEQDELLKSFRSIRSKEEKKINNNTSAKKINKPTSLPVSSSHYTKKQKRGCDNLFTKDQKNRKKKGLCESKQFWANSSDKETSYFFNKERTYDTLSKEQFSKKEKFFQEKFDRKEDPITEEEEAVSIQTPKCCFSCGSNGDFYADKFSHVCQDILVEEDFVYGHGEGEDCGLECCKRKDLGVDDVSTVTPCSPEMDASGGGPDSGLDTCSTGCIPGGGFSTPREHTVSETSGVDLTEAAIGEDMPHDGDSELNLPKPSKSSGSSSVSSEAGTWDSTFPPPSGQELQDDQRCIPRVETVLGASGLGLEQNGQTVNKSCPEAGVPLQECTSNLPESLPSAMQQRKKDAISEDSLNKQSTVPVEKTVSDLEQRNNLSFGDAEQTVKYESLNETFDISDTFNESNASEILTESCDTDMLKHRRKVSSLGDLHSEYLVDSHQPTSGEKCNDWKIDTSAGASNNYFINAASLVDDSEFPTSLPPLFIHEPEYKTKNSQNGNALEKEDSSPGESVTKTPTSSPTEKLNQSEEMFLAVNHEDACLPDSPPSSICSLNPILGNTVSDSAPLSTANVEDSNEEITSNTQEISEGNSEPPVTRVTFLKMGGTRHEVKLLNGQDLFAEFQKEIRMTEHLEPCVVRKGVRSRWESGSDDLSNRNDNELPGKKIEYDNSCEIQEKHETETVVENKPFQDKDSRSKHLSTTTEEEDKPLVPAPESHEVDEKGAKEESDEKEGPRRPSLIRRNTFELDPDEEHLALLRQEYERRQGNLLFQNCIPQFSGHITGSEGFRDAQSLLVLGSDDSEDIQTREDQQISLPSLPVGDSLGPASLVDMDVAHLRPTSSLSGDSMSSFLVEQHVLRSGLPPAPTTDPHEEFVYRGTEDEIGQGLENEDSSQECSMKERSEKLAKDSEAGYISDERSGKDDYPGFSRQSSYDIACKPVISGALTCSDLGLEDKRMWESPKKTQKRSESTPIVSGGVSSVDFSVPVRKVSESPVMRRKNEAAPILSGAAPVLPEPKETTVEIKPVSCMSSSAAWIVDMSDCATSGAKPPLDTRKHRKSDSTSGVIPTLLQTVNLKDVTIVESPQKKTDSKNSSLGFFVDLKASPGRDNADIKRREKKDGIHDLRLQKSLESTPVNVGYFVGFEEAKTHHKEKLDRKSSSFEEKREFKRQSSKSDDQKSSYDSSSEYPSMELSTGGHRDGEHKKLSSEDEKESTTPDRKSAIFSMFIDIGDTKQDSPARHGSTESVKCKVASSPLLSSHKKLVYRRSSVSKDSSDRSSHASSGAFDSEREYIRGESPKGTYMYIDASIPSSKTDSTAALSQPSSLEDSSDSRGAKKQSFFMYIENESPVIRRKTLPSGLRPTFNRHSWNPETRSTLQTEDQRLSARKNHKRAHSVSVDRSSVCSPGDEHKSSSSSSLAKARQQGSSHSLCESATVEIGMPQMSASCHARLSSKAHEKFVQHSLSVEEQMEEDLRRKSPKNFSGHSSHKISLPGNVDVRFTVSEANVNLLEVSHIERAEELRIQETVEVPVYDKSALRCRSAGHTTDVDVEPLKIIEEPKQTVFSSDKTTKQSKEFHECSPGSFPPALSSSESIPNVLEVHASENAQSEVYKISGKDEKTTEELVLKSEETTSGSFVRLSDLDKEPPKTRDSDPADLLPSFSSTNRMTRSIPETSWIENKLLMTRSIGSGSTSKSLSRLFPHLHTSGSAASSPSSMSHSKSPGGQMDHDDNDMQVSETSDLSSMQSSMGPSGLEGSTEETDASSSYAGRSGPVSRLGEDLLRMFLEEINPDVTVEVGGRRMKAHKCILSSRCQYFAAMLSGGWVESAGNVISLQGFSYNAVHFALCHIYSGTSNIPDTISIVELATLADMLGLEGLKEVIMYTLKVKYCHFFHKPCTMCTVGVLECLPLAAAYGLDEIYRKSLRWITKYFVRIWPTKGFASLPRELIEKCYQQHIVHMSVDNVLETVMCCDKLIATLPNVRWAEPVFGITSQLLEASIKFIANNFCGVLTSENFLSLGKELSWNISRLEDSIMAATERLPPDQACQSYSRLYQILSVARSPEPPPEMQWSQSFLELLGRVQKRVEASLVRQAPRAARCQSWSLMEPELRKKIQELACLVLAPSDDTHRSRLSNLSKRSSSGSNSVYGTGPRSVSSTGLRSLDLRQVRLAMTQQARRTASGGRISTLKADSKPKVQVKQPHPPQVKKETTTTDDSSKASNGEASSRPKTWPMRVLENKSRPVKCRVNSSSSNTATPEKSGSSAPRRSGKIMISSSDSSRTSSPAMRRSAPSSDGSGRGRSSALCSSSNRSLTNRTDTPPGREVRSKKKREGEITAISADSLTESPSSGSTRRCTKDITESTTSRSCGATRPDTPSVRRKVREEVAISTDSLASVANGEKVPAGIATNHSLASRSDISRERGKSALGKLGVEVAISTDSLATDSSYAGEISVGSKEDGKRSKSPSGSIRSEGKGSTGKLVRVSCAKTDAQRSPAPATRKLGRQSVSSPRDSPTTTRLRSGVSSSPYTGSPSLRRSLLLASKSSENASTNSSNSKQNINSKTTAVAKSERLTAKLLSSPSASSVNSKRTPTRNQTRAQVVASPSKPLGEGSKNCATKNSPKDAVSAGKVTTSMGSSIAKKCIYGTADGRNKRNVESQSKLSNSTKRGEHCEERPPTVGSRSGTFLKDEPTILKKPDTENVQE